MLSPWKINHVLLWHLSEDIPPMQLPCSCVRLHHTPNEHSNLRWQQVTPEAELEQSRKYLRHWPNAASTQPPLVLDSIFHCNTILQQAATCPPAPHIFCIALHALGKFCIPLSAPNPVPSEWTSVSAPRQLWNYPREPESHRPGYLSCSIKKRENWEQIGNILLCLCLLFLTVYALWITYKKAYELCKKPVTLALCNTWKVTVHGSIATSHCD